MNNLLVNYIPFLLLAVTVVNAARLALADNGDLAEWLIGDSSYGVKFCLRLVIAMPLAGIVYSTFRIVWGILGLMGLKYIVRKIAEVLADK